MTEYEIIFSTKVTATDRDDLYLKSEKISEKLSKALHKSVENIGYAEIKDVQRKLI